MSVETLIPETKTDINNDFNPVEATEFNLSKALDLDEFIYVVFLPHQKHLAVSCTPLPKNPKDSFDINALCVFGNLESAEMYQKFKNLFGETKLITQEEAVTIAKGKKDIKALVLIEQNALIHLYYI